MCLLGIFNKLWCTDINLPKCIISRDVVFNEAEVLKKQDRSKASVKQVLKFDEFYFNIELKIDQLIKFQYEIIS